ncbi:MAG: hypothetical protein Sapg2KO_52380 [Saprospiraceae bacterium]
MWTGSTPSSSTGPSAAQEGSFYAYAESNIPCATEDYTITSPCYDLSGQATADISFYYHMYGSAMGPLVLEITTNGGSSWSSLWNQSGDQGNNWKHQVINLDAYTGQTIQLRFVGTVGYFRSDFALDNITVSAAGPTFPDLVNQNLSVPSSAIAGTAISVSSEISNQGEAAAGSSTLAYYLSTDNNYDNSDTNLGQNAVGSIEAGSSSSVSASLDLPIGLSSDTYYILFVTDASSVLVESDENNNVEAQAIMVSGLGGSNQWEGPDDLVGDIYHTGKVGIGITNFDTDDYLLYVNDGIKAEKVKVELPGGGWSDFVFEKNYQLRPLEEVADFINQNGHLPEMPSEQELKDAQGFDLGEIVKLQQMKIEELTLYLIQQNVEIKTNLMKQIKELQLQNKILENRIKLLEKH